MIRPQSSQRLLATGYRSGGFNAQDALSSGTGKLPFFLPDTIPATSFLQDSNDER